MTMATVEPGLRIAGRSVTGTGDTFEVIDPAYERAITSLTGASVDDAVNAVDAAAESAGDWAARAPRERAEILRRAFELMTTRRTDLAELIVRENGKPLTDARGEVAYAAEFFRWYSEEAVRVEGVFMRAPSGTNEILVVHQPVGVCVLVTPWNFPAAMATRKIGPALAAGCTVVLKPASETPLTALLIADILSDAGVPPGVVNVLPSRQSGEVVGAMVRDPRVRKLSFTGSTEVGRDLLALAAENVVNSSMELGGNAPFIVLADADLDAAVEGALVAKMRNVGEACTAANRFYVNEALASDFATRLSDRMANLSIGPGLDPGVAVGPLINAVACEKIDELLADARDVGARVLTGGQRLSRSGYFYAPTVLSNVPAEAVILGEEIFGPVAPIVPFADLDDVVARANDTEHGLVSYIYTSDRAAGIELGLRLETGMVGLNRGIVSDPAAPFGGVKQSGIGREGGREGLLDYTESKYFAIAH